MMMNSNTTATVHYDLTGNLFYMRPSSGFCGATNGAFTASRDDVTCAACNARVDEIRQ